MAEQASDADVLKVFALTADPALSAPEVAERLDITQQAAHSRLSRMANDGLLRTKKIGARARIYWLTDKGRDHLADDAGQA